MINKKDKGYVKKDMCLTNNLNIIKILFEEGVDINGYSICGHTPLHYHVKEGNFNIVKYLLSKGADMNKQNIYGDNILDDALEFGQHEIYEYLITSQYAKKC